MTDPPAVLSDRYRLDGEIGRGGAGRVYRAHDDRLDRAVAVKVLTDLGETAVARFRREAATAARIRHPNVVTLHDAGVDERPYLVMSLVEGKSLSARVEEEGPLSFEDLHRLADDMFAGVEATHAAGVLHRDLTPRNVLFDHDGRALLADFGIARSAEDPTLTAEHTVMGTRPFVAPERLRGEVATEATDVYAVGVTLAFAGTGDHGSALPDTHPFAPVVAACTAEDPATRPTPREAIEGFDAIASRLDASLMTAPMSAVPTDPDHFDEAAPGTEAIGWTTGPGQADGPDDDATSPRRLGLVLGLVVLAVLTAVVGSALVADDPSRTEPDGAAETAVDEVDAPSFDPEAPGTSARDLARWLRERDG